MVLNIVTYHIISTAL